MWAVIYAGLVLISLGMGKMSVFAHKWEKGDSSPLMHLHV